MPPKRRKKKEEAPAGDVPCAAQGEALQEVVLKTALLKYLQGNERTRKSVAEAVERRVRAYSARAHLGSVIVCGIVKDLLKQTKDAEGRLDARRMAIPPEFFSDTFMFQAFTNAAGANLHPLIEAHLLEHPHLRAGAEVRYLSDTNIYAYGSQQYLTNLKNSLWMNLEGRIHGFFKAYGRLKKRCKQEARALGALAAGTTPRIALCLREEDAQCVAAHCAAMGLAERPPSAEDPAYDVATVTAQALARYREVTLARVFARAQARAEAAPGIAPNKVKAYATAIARRLLGWSPGAKAPALSEEDAAWCTYARERMGLAGDSACDLERHWAVMLRYVTFQNQERERLGLPLFNLVPICGAKRHFVRLDTLGLHGVMRDAGLLGRGVGIQTFAPLAKEQWESILRLDALLGSSSEKRARFTGLVDTDGVSLCTHHRRVKGQQDETRADKKERVSKDEEATSPGGATGFVAPAGFRPRPDDRVIGLDPGRVNIYSAVEELPESSGGGYRRFRLTRRGYNATSGIAKAARRSARWSKAIRPALIALSKASSRGACPSRHAAFLQAHEAHYRTLLGEFCHKRRWARQRLRLYGGKQRVMHRFFSAVRLAGAPDRRVVVAYGASGHASGGPGEMSVPVEWAHKQCSMAFPTVKVDEFRTTVTNCKDDTVLEKVNYLGTGRRCRDLLWAAPPPPLTSARGRFVDRDGNAAANILRCYNSSVARGAPRPAALSRSSPNLTPIPQRATKCLRMTRR